MLEECVSKKTTRINVERQLFQLFFLKDDENKSVEVIEVEEIDFIDILRRLECGESVFIAPKRKQEFSSSLVTKKVSKEDAAEPWYFTHF